MKKLRLILWLYIALDLFIGGHNGGLLPLPLLVPQAKAQSIPIATSTGPSAISFVAGKFVANEYSNYGNPLDSQVYGGNASTGSSTITLRGGYIVLKDGRSIVPFAVGVPIVINDTTPELVTPTAVSGCYKSQGMNQDAILVTCSVTASFSFTHGIGASVSSGTAGAAEAANDAVNWGGGVVVLAPGWKAQLNTSCTNCYANQTAALQAILPYPNVTFEDDQQGPPLYWNPTPAFGTAFSAPSALASGTAFSSTTVAGSASYTGGTIHLCYSLVDIMGHEGPCSSDYSFADTSAKAIVFTAPPPATGAVGWIPYIGLESGATQNEYQVKLWTQPSVTGNLPVGNGVCTLSPILLPAGIFACAISNATYGETGSGATVAAYPVVTSPLPVFAGGQDGSAPNSYLEGNTASRTVYQYQPGASPGTPGVNRTYAPFNITTAAASTVPQILGTLDLPAGFMNYVGRSVEICGYAYSSTQGASTIVQIEFEWDAQGSDVTTGLPVKLGGPMALGTLTTGTVASFDFCQDITTTVAAAGATGGSLQTAHGYLAECALNTCATPFVAPNVGPAASASTGSAPTSAVGSLNLAGPSRIHIVMVQTTSSTAVPKLVNLTMRVLN